MMSERQHAAFKVFPPCCHRRSLRQPISWQLRGLPRQLHHLLPPCQPRPQPLLIRSAQHPQEMLTHPPHKSTSMLLNPAKMKLISMQVSRMLKQALPQPTQLQPLARQAGKIMIKSPSGCSSRPDQAFPDVYYPLAVSFCPNASPWLGFL